MLTALTDNRQLALYIERGLALPGVIECQGKYLTRIANGYLACALSLALLGKVGDIDVSVSLLDSSLKRWLPPYALGRLIGINSNLALAIDLVHSPQNGRSARQIAERLCEEKPLSLLESY